MQGLNGEGLSLSSSKKFLSYSSDFFKALAFSEILDVVEHARVDASDDVIGPAIPVNPGPEFVLIPRRSFDERLSPAR
jgi:hypothetical protein